MIKRLGTLLALSAIAVGACSSGGTVERPPHRRAAGRESGPASAAAPQRPRRRRPRPATPAPRRSSIWADDKRAAALKPFAEKFGDGERRHRRGPGHLRGPQTNFVTASQQGSGPDVVVWAHDGIGNLVQNGAIDPVQRARQRRRSTARHQGHDLQRPALRRARTRSRTSR